MTNSEEKAHPEITTDEAMDRNQNSYGNTYSYGGLTKREYFAAMAMQGILISDESQPYKYIAQNACIMADALINALNQKESPVMKTHPMSPSDRREQMNLTGTLNPKKYGEK